MQNFIWVFIGQRDKSGSLEDSSPTKSISENSSRNFQINAFVVSTSIQIPSGMLCSLEEEEETEEEISNNDLKQACSFNSQLSKTLPEILTDKNTLGYFIQFMETRKRIALIKFWLEVECLCNAYGMSSCTEKVKCQNQKELVHALPTSLDNNENFSCNILVNNVNTQTSNEVSCNENVNDSDDPTSILNGMPKTSQIVKEVRQSNRHCKDKSHNITTSKQDVLRIYKKYILKETLGINQILEELKLDMEKAIVQENIEPMLRCLSIIQSIVYDILENE